MCTGGDPGERKESTAGSRVAPPTREEMTARRAPASSVSAPSRDLSAMSRAAERNVVARATPAQTSFDAIQELRGRYDSQPPSALGLIARTSLDRQIAALQGGAIPVQTRTDSGQMLTVGTITREGSYTGRSEYGDLARQRLGSGGMASIDVGLGEAMTSRDAEEQRERSEPDRPVVAAAEEVETVTQVGTGSGNLTTQRRRGGGRRTAFGTRQSLVNLRNV